MKRLRCIVALLVSITRANPPRNFLRACKAAIPARVPVTVNAASAVEVGMGSRVRDFVHLLSASGPWPANDGGYS